jgi:hypothetical protein
MVVEDSVHSRRSSTIDSSSLSIRSEAARNGTPAAAKIACDIPGAEAELEASP